MLKTKTIEFKLVSENDAEFILRLRLDPKYNNFLSKVDADLSAQKNWIKNYKEDEINNKQFYFVIINHDGIPCGTVRLYDFKEDSFCWGSWILNKDKTKTSAIESAYLVYKFAFETLGYRKSHFDVRKENLSVISFHKKMGAIQTGEDELNVYFEINKNSVDKWAQRYKGKIL
ncbi:TPA: GNAT family N-acetyltransferase [Vibrio parahaemolyticus]|nr:GNAT family N-acetyltransferase [Vibrio parahaemolyticus]